MLKEISNLCQKFTSVEEVATELKRIQSVKCRLKKQKAKKTYEEEMTEVVKYEQALKEVREYFVPKTKTVTTFTQEDINLLNHEETLRAIKSIQSKKCNSQYLTENIETNEEYQNACKIERMLLEHKKLVKPIEETVVKKSEISDLINNLENLDKIKKDDVLERLKKLLG